MFNDKVGLTKAVLKGKKTMTRRLVSKKTLEEYANYDDYCNSMGLDGIGMPVTRKFEKEFFLERSPYKVGEVIAIAMNYEYIFYTLNAGLPEQISVSPGWTNKMFVRADLMPYAIKITDVKVEQLKDISPEDCLREGIIKVEDKNTGYCRYGFTGCRQDYPNPLIAFKELWRAISGKYSFHFDAWVYAYSFEVINNPNY